MTDTNLKADFKAWFNSYYIQKELVNVLKHKRGNIFLLGTHHNREQCAIVVGELINQIRPHIVAVELCRTNLERYNVNPKHETTHMPSAGHRQQSKSTYMDIIPPRLKDKAVGEELILGLLLEALRYENNCRYKDHVKNSVLRNAAINEYRLKPKNFHNMKIGQEMTIPFGDLVWTWDEKKPLYLKNPFAPYKILLVDKPVEETFCKIAASLTDVERKIIHIYQMNFLKLFIRYSSKKTLAMNLLEKNAKLKYAILTDRDNYMASTLKKALLKHVSKKGDGNVRMVCVVGKSHVPGIIEHWEKIATEKKTPKAKAKEKIFKRK